MSGRRSEGRAGHRVLRKAWALPAILLSGALMLISSGPPATAGPAGQQRGSSVATAPSGVHGPAAPSVTAGGDVRDLPVTAAPATGKLGYAPPASVGTVAGLDRYLLDTVPAPTGRVPADDAWTTTDPQRGPPAIRQ
ncbi:hypothetical protein [Jiangella anatolica]|uniref:Uncharacterized protein n=1 Tax=Jiangella anatolica TaxID=2670374 RepID=A0A2W2CAR5_9ACTN|nr:hypothetical protein [Jiangella anatolica]PZF85269.1 hypothetical protein C1I92_05325 [Jiangella anatolica]